MLLLAVAALPSGAAELRTLGVGVSHGPVSLLIHVAESMRLFEQEGVAIRRLRCESGRECFERLRAGDVDVATAAEFVVALDSIAGGDAAIIGTISSSSRQIKLIARRGPSGDAPGQLAGRRIGTVAGSSAQYFLHNWLLHHAIDPRDVRIVPASPDRLVPGLVRREFDAVAIWEPLAGEARRALRDEAVELPVPLVYTQHFNLVSLRRGLPEREAALMGLLRGLLRAQQALAAVPARGRQILAAQLGISPEQAGPLMAEHDYRLRLDQTLANTLRSQGRWALREGLAPAGGRGEQAVEAIEAGLLGRLAPSAVSIAR